MEDELLTKSDIIRYKNWTYEFLTDLIEDAGIQGYKVGKRIWYKLIDIDAGLESRKGK